MQKHPKTIQKKQLNICPEFYWNGTLLDLKILLTIILASKLLRFKGQKSNINLSIKQIIGLFNHKFTSVSSLKSDIKRTIKHKSCGICAVFSKSYEQIFFRETENKALR